MILMGKKIVSGLVAGLLGAGLYAAYQKLDENKKNQLKRNLREKTDEVRDRAVDYAFYANDAVSDFKDVIKDELNNAKGTVKDAGSQFTEKATTSKSQRGADDLNESAPQQDDIVVDAREAFKSTDSTDSVTQSTTSPDSSTNADPSGTTSNDDPSLDPTTPDNDHSQDK